MSPTGQFDLAMHNIYVRAREEEGYNPSYFLQMLDDLGGVGAAKQLINSSKPSDGFTKLWELGRLDLSVEALVLDPQWSYIFTEGELAKAAKRLRQYEYEVEPSEVARSAVTVPRAAALINQAAAGHPFGELQEIRKELKDQERRATAAIFSSQSVNVEFAFHSGGREELQFNIGTERRGDDILFRHGVAFSLEPSRSLPDPLDVLLPKIARYNEFMDQERGRFDYLRFWFFDQSGVSEDFKPRPIRPAEAQVGNFLFLGARYSSEQFDEFKVLDDWRKLLPLFEYVESRSGRAVFSPMSSEPEFKPGHRPRQQEVGSRSKQEGELRVEYRHNQLQQKLYERLCGRFGAEAVRTEWPCAGGMQVDLAVRVGEDEYWFYEIKTSHSARYCIRQGLAQILEYAYWPDVTRASKLLIVGESEPDEEAVRYLDFLRDEFELPVFYEACPLVDSAREEVSRAEA